MGFASQRRHREEHERRAPALLEPMFLASRDHQDVPRLQSRLPALQGQCPAPRGHEDLMLPVMTMNGRPTALLNADLVQGGLFRAVLPSRELFHQDAGGADLSEPYSLQRPDIRPV